MSPIDPSPSAPKAAAAAPAAIQKAEAYVSSGRFDKAVVLLQKAESATPGAKGLAELLAVAQVCGAAAAGAGRCARCQREIGAANGGAAKFVDWYKVLQVDSSADDLTVKKRYRQLALLLHPDKNQQPKAEEAFKHVKEAYSVLGDSNKKAIFKSDRQRASTCASCTAVASRFAKSSSSGSGGSRGRGSNFVNPASGRYGHVAAQHSPAFHVPAAAKSGRRPAEEKKPGPKAKEGQNAAGKGHNSRQAAATSWAQNEAAKLQSLREQAKAKVVSMEREWEVRKEQRREERRRDMNEAKGREENVAAKESAEEVGVVGDGADRFVGREEAKGEEKEEARREHRVGGREEGREEETEEAREDEREARGGGEEVERGEDRDVWEGEERDDSMERSMRAKVDQGVAVGAAEDDSGSGCAESNGRGGCEIVLEDAEEEATDESRWHEEKEEDDRQHVKEKTESEDDKTRRGNGTERPSTEGDASDRPSGGLLGAGAEETAAEATAEEAATMGDATVGEAAAAARQQRELGNAACAAQTNAGASGLEAGMGRSGLSFFKREERGRGAVGLGSSEGGPEARGAMPPSRERHDSADCGEDKFRAKHVVESLNPSGEEEERGEEDIAPRDEGRRGSVGAAGANERAGRDKRPAAGVECAAPDGGHGGAGEECTASEDTVGAGEVEIGAGRVESGAGGVKNGAAEVEEIVEIGKKTLRGGEGAAREAGPHEASPDVEQRGPWLRSHRGSMKERDRTPAAAAADNDDAVLSAAGGEKQMDVARQRACDARLRAPREEQRCGDEHRHLAGGSHSNGKHLQADELLSRLIRLKHQGMELKASLHSLHDRILARRI